MKKPLPSAQRIEETTPRRGLFRFGVLFGVKWVGLFLAAVYCAVVGAALAAKLLSFGLSGTPACRGGWDIGFALLGESLFLEWPRKSNQKEGHPCIRVLLRKTPLATALLRGSSRRAIPGPSLLARHPCLATPYATPTLGLLKGARDRVVWTFLNSNKAPSSFNGEQSRRMDATIKLLRWASPILRSKAHCTMLRLLISGTDQQTPPNAPFRRPNGIAAQRGERHGCRERTRRPPDEGPWMALARRPSE